MPRGKGLAPAPKRPLATAQAPLLRRLPATASSTAPPLRQPPSAVPRRHPVHSTSTASKGAVSAVGSGRAPTAGAQFVQHGTSVAHRDKSTAVAFAGICGHSAQRGAGGDAWESCDAKSAQVTGSRAGKAVQKGVTLHAVDNKSRPVAASSSGPSANHVISSRHGVTTAKAAGIPRLSPAKRPPDPRGTSPPSSAAAARVREWTTAVSQHHSATASSHASSQSSKRGESREEEERRKRARRLALDSRRTPQQQSPKDRTSSASSPAILTGRTPPPIALSSNVTRRNTEGPHRRRREPPDADCCEATACQRRVEERLQLELNPEIDERGPSKSGIVRGEVSRGRNGGGGTGAATRTAETPAGVGATAVDREEASSLSASTEHLEHNHHANVVTTAGNHHGHPQPPAGDQLQQQQPPRQLGRRKLAAAAAAAAASTTSSGDVPPPRVLREPSPPEADDRGGGGVMVGREEGEEGGGRVVARSRMDTGSRKRREEEEEGDEGVVVREVEEGRAAVVPGDAASSGRLDIAVGVKHGGGVGVGDDGARGGSRPRSASPPPRSSSLEKQLAALGREKSELETKLAAVLEGADASREEVDQLRQEVADLKCQKSADLDALEEENRALRERLRELNLAARERIGDGGGAREAASALSDTEKEQLLLARSPSGQALSTNSADAMGCSSGNSVEGGGDGGISNVSENALCPTPDWDKQSSSSLSEVSVACLQDRILQMEETHYSTNEELQATLQELADLQAQLTELQSENERLSEEKSVLLESLCRQTEKLEDTRSRADTLEELLLGTPQSSSLPPEALDERGEPVGELALANGSGEGPDLVECSDREQKLVELLKSAQEERENLLSRLEDLKVQLEEAREAWSSRGEESARLQDRVRLLESALEAANAERRELDKELGATKEESSARQIQISRLSTLLDNARAKIEELEQAREVRDKCELDNLLDHARKEKDALESQVASLQEKLSHSQCEVTRLKDSVCSLQEECKVARNNAKSALSDLEYQLEQGRSEMALLAEEVRRQTEEAAGACAQSQRHLEDKRTLKAALSEAQRATVDAERRVTELKSELEEEKKTRKEENEEWERFQSDLLVTVRVANDFKNEAKLELEKYVLENRGLKEKIKGLEVETEKLKASPRSSSPAPSTNSTSSALSTQTERRGLALRTVSAPPASVTAGSEGANVGAILSSVMQQQQEAMAVRRQKPGGISRADSRLSVKSLIESIENATKQVKAGPGGGSRSSSTSSLSSITSADPRGSISLALTSANPGSNNTQSQTIPTDSSDSDVFTVGNGSIKTPLRDQQQNNNQVASLRAQRKALSVSDGIYTKPSLHDSLKGSTGGVSCSKNSDESIPLNTVSILSNKMDFVRRNSYGDLTAERKDPLSALVRNGGSRRNALLKWCQNKTVGYRNIDITNFSSSWNDGLAFCALLHTYLADRIPYDSLTPSEKRKNFSLAFSAAESVGIPTSLNINEMIQLERPDWQQVMSYVTSIYKHFET
ncbi:cytospin-A [Hetaerina americana]|uniref:cytospin-A n=1 Tax=Hetaerina americana TaxID=62018 RepID=UPI003A7F4255